MSEVNTQENTTAVEQEKTFTQDEVNAIVKDRLTREREKYADYDEIRAKADQFTEFQESQKSELQKANERANALQAQLDSMAKANSIREIREKVSRETGVPASLLIGEDEETCTAHANAILEYAKPANSYPNVLDYGEVTAPRAGKTRDQFADWFNSSLKKE